MMSPRRPAAVPPPRRLVVRGVNWLGDAVMTTPALLRLREALPGAHIALLTHEKLAELWTNHPALDDVITFGARDTVLTVARRLRGGKFDTALLLPNSARAALEAALARIPRRVGYAGGGRTLLLTHALRRRDGFVAMHKRSDAEIRRLLAANATATADLNPVSAHHVHHYLHLVSALGAKSEPLPPRIAVSDAEAADVVKRLVSVNHDGGIAPLFGLVPGAEYGPAKRWPRERFLAAAIEIHRHTNCRWLLFGGKADAPLCAEIADEFARGAGTSSSIQRPASCIVNLAGRTTLRELCALLRACRVVLTNDTGPMHVAAAVGAPVVALFGSTSRELTAPGQPGDARHQLLAEPPACAPCFRRECPVDSRCLTALSVERVVQAVLRAAKG